MRESQSQAPTNNFIIETRLSRREEQDFDEVPLLHGVLF